MALTTGNILTYADNNHAFADITVAPDGSFYAIMDASNETGIAVLKYNSGTQSWDNYASFEPSDVGVSGFSDDLDIAITSNGNVHVVFKYSTYTNDPVPWNSINAPRGVKYGEFNGSNWTFTTIEEGTPVHTVSSVGFDDPQLLVDNNDVVQVTYQHRFSNLSSSTSEYNLKYALKNGGTFDVSTPVQWSGASTASGINEVSEPFIYEGPAGSLYMIYLDEDNFNGSGNLYVKTKPSGGAWSAGQLLLGTPGGPNPNNTLYADTDENGSLHIFYYDGVGEKLYDLNNTSGTFQAEAVLPSLSNIYGFGGYQAIGGKEYIHVTTNNGSVEGHLYSRSAGTGSWTQEFAINGGGADTDFAINSSGEIMFLISDSLGSGSGGNGNAVTFATDTIVSDTTPPAAPSITSISSDTGSSNSDFITNDTSLTITGAAEAGASVAVSDSNGVIGTVTANSSGIWTLVHTFAEGTTSLTAIATDAAGNASSASTAQSLTVDTTQPVAFGAPDLANASDTGSSNSDNITNNTTPTFTGLAEVGATVELFYGGTNSLGSTTVGAGNAWSITATTIPAGDHQITAVVTDTAGNSTTSPALSITVDTTAPSTPSITSISSDTGASNSDFITNDTSLTITGTAEAGASVAVSDSNGVIGTVTANSSGIWTLVHTFAEGTTSLSAIATDAAGNASSASAAQSLTVDTTQPVAFGAPDLANASDTGSSNSDNITNNTTPTFTGLAEVGATVELFYGGTNSLGSTTVGAGNAWSITATTIPAGDHQITAVVTDTAGNSTTSPALSITVDTTAPSVPSVPDLVVASDLGSSDTDDLTSDTTPTFVGTADAGAIVELFYGGTNSLGTVIADSSGNWTITATTLPEGIQNITALARDTAGNTSAASAALSVTIDTTAPAAPSTPDLLSSSDTGSSNTDNITGDATPTFAGTAAANATVEVFYGETNSLGTTSADAAGNWTLTATTMPDGDHNITARVMDAAGNLSPASSGLDITIDAGPASPPTVTSVSPDTGTSTTDGVTNTQTLSFSGTAPANSSVEVFVDNSSIGSTMANALGVWTIASASPLSEGTHAVTAIATTVVGNVSSPSQAYSVTVDTTTPTLSDIDLVDASDDGSSNSDDRTSVRTPTIAYTAEAGSTVEINFGDGNGYQAANPGNGSQQTATLASAYATEGLKAIQVRVTDLAGNQVTKALGIVVNFKPTDITLSSASIAENSAEGSVIGALTVVDPTVVESHTLAITNDPDGLFAIDGGNLVVGAGADLDFEAGETRTVEITATDSIGGQVAVSLDVTLTDVREDIGGTDSADTLSAGAGLDDFTLGEGEDVVETTFDNISGDTFSDFGAGDELIFTDISFEKDQVTITGTSPYTVEIDRDNDGTADTTFTIESNLEDGEIMVVSRGGETTISQESFLPTLSEGASVDTSNVNGINSQTFLTGTGSLGFRVTIDSTQLGASFKNSLGVYEVDAAGNIIDVRMLVADTTSAVGAPVNVTDVEDGHKLGFFIVQDGADFIDGLSNTDTFSFIDSQDDTAATLTTGSSTALAVNGSVVNVTTFHSIESSLNSDDIQHALSGVNTGGTSITIGFEDMTGGGDRDYQDVVFSVETYDII